MSADVAVVHGDSQTLRTTSGLTSEPIVRVPLSQVEQHRAELAALRARVAELESWLAEMPELRAECERLGDELHAIRAVLGPKPLPEHFERNPFAELTEQARLLVEEVYGSDPRPRDVRRVAHDRARVEHIKLVERALRSVVHQNRSMRRTLQMAAEALGDAGVAAALGMVLPRPTVDTAASAARTWLATGGPTRVHEIALSERAQRRLVRWFGRTPGRASHELAQRSGSRVVAEVHAEMETIEAAKMKRTPMAPTTEPVEAPAPMTKASKRSKATPSTPPSTTAQVDIEEAIERAKSAPTTKPKRSRAKKSEGPPAPTSPGPFVIVRTAAGWDPAAVPSFVMMKPQEYPGDGFVCTWYPERGLHTYDDHAEAVRVAKSIKKNPDGSTFTDCAAVVLLADYVDACARGRTRVGAPDDDDDGTDDAVVEA